jgi:hypothetical protein
LNDILFKVRQNGSSPNVAMSTATVKSEQPRVIMRDMSVQNTYTPPTAHDLDIQGTVRKTYRSRQEIRNTVGES